jgi:hypothetical protein
MSTIRKFNKDFRINEDESFREIEGHEEQPIDTNVEGGIVTPNTLQRNIHSFQRKNRR